MVEMTAAEALARAGAPDRWTASDEAKARGADPGVWAQADVIETLRVAQGILPRLRALGFAIVPIEATAVIERMAHAIAFAQWMRNRHTELLRGLLSEGDLVEIFNGRWHSGGGALERGVRDDAMRDARAAYAAVIAPEK